MNELKVNRKFEYWYSATEEFAESMKLLGFNISGCYIQKGSHIGEFWALNGEYDRIEELVKKGTVAVTNNREFYISRSSTCSADLPKFYFSVRRNK